MTIPNDANIYLPGVIAIPSSLTLIAISNAFPAIATVSVNPITESNTYIPGQLVRLNIPVTYGMYQANGLTVKINEVNGNDLTLDLNTSHFDVFTVPSGNVLQPATIAPSGSRNLTLDNTTGQVPFQSLNNIGN